MIPSILMMPIRSAGCQIRICEHQINFFLWTAGSYKLYCSVSGLNCRVDHDAGACLSKPIENNDDAARFSNPHKEHLQQQSVSINLPDSPCKRFQGM